jgi:putative ABC transport system ATP-binding protein
VTAPLVEVEGLCRTFGAGRTLVHAVRGVDLASGAGEITLVMGPSGSGKTTLLTMIGGLLRPTSGRVRVAGEELSALPPHALTAARRRLIGFVFQTFALLDALSAQENVELALNVAGVRRPESSLRARELLVTAGLEDRLGFRAHDLSAGEKQRVALARALANRPPLLLADEPTANLDSVAGAEVMALLRRLATTEGRGAVVVSHDDRLVSIADRFLRLEDGRLAEHEKRVTSA